MKYLSYFSGLQYWNIPLLNDYYAAVFSQVKKSHYTVRSRKEIAKNSDEIYHLCTTSVPKSGFITDQGVVSPAFLFLQMAESHDIIELIILGCLLCSCPNGPFSDPLVLKKDIHKFVEATKMHRGKRKALQALKHVKDRSCSIMEIFVHLFFGLPNHLGGLGLKGGELNYRLDLNADGQKAMGKRVCFVDYCFPEQKIACEYLGEIHAGSLDYDSTRTTAISDMGYRVITITKSQLYNHDRRMQLFKRVLKAHKIHRRIRTDKYEFWQNRIHTLLPRFLDTIDY